MCFGKRQQKAPVPEEGTGAVLLDWSHSLITHGHYFSDCLLIFMRYLNLKIIVIYLSL